MTRAALELRLRRLAARDRVLREMRDAARQSSAELWLVGGAVRDAARKAPVVDLDFAAAEGLPALRRRLAAAWGQRGFRFRKRGVTTWRFSPLGRQVDIVDASGRGISEDLRRRDFTVNAVAFDLVRGRVFDPLRGLADLRAGILRLPRPGVVREDPLRALRAARFLAQLPGFRLHRGARGEALANAARIRKVSVERVREELDRVLRAPRPAVGLLEAERLGLLEIVLPEIASLRRCTAGEDRPDVLRHTADALDLAAGPRTPFARLAGRARDGAGVLRWALLVHDIAKPERLGRREDGRPTFHGHEVAGARRSEALLKRLKLARDLRRRVARMVLFHLRPHHLADAGATPRGLRRLVHDAAGDLPVLAALAACDALASGAPDARARWKRLRPVLSRLVALHDEAGRAPLAALVDGRDVMRILGIPPGPRVGRVLTEIREQQEEGALRSRREALKRLRTIRDEER